MPLFQRRARDAERAEKPSSLTTRLSTPVRTKVALAMFDHGVGIYEAGYGSGGYRDPIDQHTFYRGLAGVLTREWGKPAPRDVDGLIGAATDAEMLDAIEAWYTVIQQISDAVERSGGVIVEEKGYLARLMTDKRAGPFTDRVNDVFDEHDVAYQVAGERIIPRSSIAMHAEVVVPVLALTNGDARWAKVEGSYQAALRELRPGGDPADAITDVARALQEALEEVGARGNALGPLLADARKRGLLGPFDSKLADGIQTIGDWVSADRSARGDAHRSSDANRDDAWLAVRVAGALILRLAAGKRS